MKKNYCINCGKEINHRSIRCYSCNMKGKRHWNYKGKVNLKKYYCLDCNKEITHQAKRCRSCAQKNRLKNSKNHPNYKDGKAITKHFCIDCNREVSWTAKRCKECKHKFHSEQMKGKNNSNWQNGISERGYSYKFNNELKERIRKRDNYQCQNCSMTQEEHLIVRGRQLDVHHIDYNKKNCKENNLITLCDYCNIRANYNRNYWENLYKNKMKEIINAI